MAPPKRRDLYGGIDPRDVPAYSLPEAARLVGLPPSTLRAWVLGRPYPTSRGARRSKPLISPAAPGFLSFTNLVEAHVLASLRRKYELALDNVRRAQTYLERKLGVQHPLARERFKTDGMDLFVERYGAIIINASQDGQLGIKEALAIGLERVEYDEGRALRFFPLVRVADVQPKHVVIDPRIGFGRPVLEGTGIRVADVAERWRAGESIEHLATDFDVALELIEDALRAAEPPRAAA